MKLRHYKKLSRGGRATVRDTERGAVAGRDYPRSMSNQDKVGLNGSRTGLAEKRLGTWRYCSARASLGKEIG